MARGKETIGRSHFSERHSLNSKSKTATLLFTRVNCHLTKVVMVVQQADGNDARTGNGKPWWPFAVVVGWDLCDLRYNNASVS